MKLLVIQVKLFVTRVKITWRIGKITYEPSKVTHDTSYSCYNYSYFKLLWFKLTIPTLRFEHAYYIFSISKLWVGIGNQYFEHDYLCYTYSYHNNSRLWIWNSINHSLHGAKMTGASSKTFSAVNLSYVSRGGNEMR